MVESDNFDLGVKNKIKVTVQSQLKINENFFTEGHKMLFYPVNQ